MENTIYEIYVVIVGSLASLTLMLIIPCLLMGFCYLLYRRRFVTRVRKQGGENK